MAGGVCKLVPLRLNRGSGAWSVDMAELEAAITPKTKILLINTPHNPTGKVFTRDELLAIVDILNRNPHVTAVMDEVYEKLVYDGKQHTRLSSLPNMWDRTLTVSSCGKTFSSTGWKIGWVYGAAHLIKPIMLANQWIQFSVSTPAQRAMASVLQQAELPYEGHESYYDYIRSVYESKRNFLVDTLRDARLPPFSPEGGFFIMADTSAHAFPVEHMADPLPSGLPATRDWGFA
ncbi:ccbl, partial [Symbiodinium microadriaticum]